MSSDGTLVCIVAARLCVGYTQEGLLSFDQVNDTVYFESFFEDHRLLNAFGIMCEVCWESKGIFDQNRSPAIRHFRQPPQPSAKIGSQMVYLVPPDPINCGNKSLPKLVGSSINNLVEQNTSRFKVGLI